MWKILLCICFISTDFVATSVTNNSSLFELSVIHMNDFHARFEEITPQSTRCKNVGCVGGFSRLYTAVNTLVRNRTNAIFLNAGDNFQGTLWYNLFGWNVTQYFLNKLPTDAHVLGNHEFDQGIEGVTPFMKALNAPIVVANINDTLEPSMKGLYNKSTILERSGRKIGIIGVILSTTNQISSTGNLSFTDEVQAVKKEADYLVKNKNCSIIIVLSHCGIEVDKKIAEEAGPYVGLVVGGHTHTFLYTGSNPPGPEKPRGTYPVVVTNKEGKKVLVVQASYNTLYLGNLTVWYDSNGNVKAWDGNAIYLDDKIPQDPDINREINEWKKEVDMFGNTVLGYSQVFLNRSTRRTGESNIGSFLTDAMVDYYVDYAEEGSWTYVSMAIINSGALRTSLVPGNITVYDLVAAQPFGNTLDCGELTGQTIKDFLEYSVTPSAVRKYQFHEFLQVSGIRVVFDPSRPVGTRVTSLKLLCNECLTPVYSNVNYSQTYRIIVPSFIANAGDGYVMIRDNLKNRKTGPKDIDVFSEYVRKRSKITQADDERIILLDSARIQDSVEYNSSTSIHVSFVTLVAIYVANSIFCFNLF